jgi:GGDEF domain-containing protein
LWSELGPDIVKIDKYFTHDISRRARKLQTVRALIQIADVFGTTLVAEGIETADDLRVIRDLGIELGQGFLLGRPVDEPRHTIQGPALDVIGDKRVAVLPSLRSAASPGRLRALQVIDADPVPPDATNDEVVALFLQHPHWPAIALVDNGRPLAIVERHQFLDRYAKGFFKEVFGRKPCLPFANTAPRLLERDEEIGELIGILTSSDQRYLTDGFIVTENGRYVGLGTADQLVRNVTESRVEAARHANPLTFLPGNIPVSEHIGRLLQKEASFVVCYADLSDFKPFNDRYGYWRGDEMIKLVAATALARTDPQRDFIGHVGGDDFIFVFQDGDWEGRCHDIVEAFNAAAIDLYDSEAREAGGIYSEDRRGTAQFFTFATLYMGAVNVGPGQFADAEQVASAAAEAKRAAKMQGLGVMVSDGVPRTTRPAAL